MDPHIEEILNDPKVTAPTIAVLKINFDIFFILFLFTSLYYYKPVEEALNVKNSTLFASSREKEVIIILVEIYL